VADLERLLSSYAWADTSQDPRLIAMSIAVARPANADLLATLGPRPDWMRELTVDEALDAGLELDGVGWRWNLIQVDELDGATVFIEPNGWATAHEAVLERLSVGGLAVSVFWNVNANMRFGYAIDGAIVRQFDPLLYDAGDAPLPEEASLPFGDGDQQCAAALTLLTALTGAEIALPWLLEPRRRTYLVPLPKE
jgi:hypothetical protein